MKHVLLALTLVVPTGSVAAQRAQASAPPVITPRIVELGGLTDSTPSLAKAPQEVSASPRGNLVAYVTDEALRVWNGATKTSAVIQNGWVQAIKWSPAGDVVAFSRPDDQGSKEYIWIVPVNPATGTPSGTAKRVSMSATTGYGPVQFSPDGQLLAFPRDDGAGRASLVVVPVAGGPERSLASGNRLISIHWTSDGNGLHYVAHTDTAWSSPAIYRVDAGGGASRRIRQLPRLRRGSVFDSVATLTNDERYTVRGRVSGRDGMTLHEMSGTPVAKLTHALNLWTDDWSDGFRIAAVRDIRSRGLQVTDIRNGSVRQLIDMTAEVGLPAWFPDGNRVAVLSLDHGAPSLVTIGADGLGVRKYPLSVRPQFTGQVAGWNGAELRVSPDGRYAIYLGTLRKSLELVDLTSGAQRTLTRSDITVTTPVWRRDSKGIRYTRDGAVVQPNATRAIHEVSITGVDKLIRRFPFSDFPGPAVLPLDEDMAVAWGQNSQNYTLVPLNGGAPRVLIPSTPMGGGQLSPDRKTIAIRLGPPAVRDYRPARQLTLVSVADASRRTVDLPFADLPLVAMQYTPDGSAILIAGRESLSAPISIYSVPINGSAPRVMARVDTREPRTAFALSPDGRYIVSTVADYARSEFLVLDYSAVPASSRQSGGKR